MAVAKRDYWRQNAPMNHWLMTLRYSAVKFARRSALPAVIGALMVYFVVQLYSGDRGLPIHNDLSERVADARSELTELQDAREALERKVSLIDPREEYPPLLEEIARDKLKLVGPNEVVIMRQR
ncbi:MAG: septum formation initiator family protein [Pseudomonadota bacterium]